MGATVGLLSAYQRDPDPQRTFDIFGCREAGADPDDVGAATTRIKHRYREIEAEFLRNVAALSAIIEIETRCFVPRAIPPLDSTMDCGVGRWSGQNRANIGDALLTAIREEMARVLDLWCSELGNEAVRHYRAISLCFRDEVSRFIGGRRDCPATWPDDCGFFDIASACVNPPINSGFRVPRICFRRTLRRRAREHFEAEMEAVLAGAAAILVSRIQQHASTITATALKQLADLDDGAGARQSSVGLEDASVCLCSEHNSNTGVRSRCEFRSVAA